MWTNLTTLTDEEYEAAVTAPARRIGRWVRFNGSAVLQGSGTDGYVNNITFNEAMEAQELSMGRTTISSCEVEIRQPASKIPLANGTFEPFVTIYSGADSEDVPLGLFYITEAPTDNKEEVIRITGYDGFVLLKNAYEPQITFPATGAQVLTDIATQRGVTISAAALTAAAAVTLSDFKEGSEQEYVGWIAGLLGKNARFGRTGELEFVYYSNTITAGISQDVQYSGGADIASLGDITVVSVTSGTETEPITSGSGTGITFTNPYMTQAILDTIQAAISNLTYRPATLQWRGDPAIECGDTVSVEIDNGPGAVLVMAHTLTVSGGLQDVLYCYGQTDRQVKLDTSPTSSRIQRVYDALQEAIANASSLINGARGGIYEVTDSDDDGINDGWIIKQSPSPDFHGKVIVANYEGIGFSTDGGATYTLALTTDGAINADLITTGRMSAERIDVNGTALGDFFYVGHRRPNDNTTPIVMRIGIASLGMVQEIMGNRSSMYKTESLEAYIADPTMSEETFDGMALYYQTDTDFVMQRIETFKIGNMMLRAQRNGGVSFVGAT